MTKNKKWTKNKKILTLVSSLVLTGGLISSVVASQLSFATNSLENSIKTLSETKTKSINNDISTYGNQNNYVKDETIGLKVGGYSPFWRWKTDDGVKSWRGGDGGYWYYQAPIAATFDPNYKGQDILTNPGIGMEWYPNANDSRAYGDFTNGYYSAGPGMFSFYTRQIEDYYYTSPTYRKIFQNLNQTSLFKETFFGDVGKVASDSIVKFVKEIVSPANKFGTNTTGQINFLDQYKEGSVLSHLLFRDFTLPDKPDELANIQLHDMVFYPSNNQPGSGNDPGATPTLNEDISTIYNKVWVGNENGQESAVEKKITGNPINDPISNYNGNVNSSIMRATTLDSFSMVTSNRSGSVLYKATGNIKFRIFYEYDFKSKNWSDDKGNVYRDFVFNMNDLKTTIPGESPATTENLGRFLSDYFVYVPADQTYTINADKMAKLIANNLDVFMKNIQYTGNDIAAGQSELKIPITKDDITIVDSGKIDPAKITATFTVRVNVEPALERTITLEFNELKNTKIIGNTIDISQDPVLSKTATSGISEAKAMEIIQNNLGQIFDVLAPDTKVTKISGFENKQGIEQGIIYLDTIYLKPVYFKELISPDGASFSSPDKNQRIMIKGFQQKPNQAELNTTVKTEFDLNKIDVSNKPQEDQDFINQNAEKLRNTLSQTLLKWVQNKKDNQSEIATLKEFLIKTEVVRNPSWAPQKIRPEDFEVYVNSCNNITGELDLRVILLSSSGNIYENGFIKSTNSEDALHNVVIKGFLTQGATKVKDNLNVVDDINNKDGKQLYANEVDVKLAQKTIDAIVAQKGITSFLENPVDTSTWNDNVVNANSINVGNGTTELWVKNTTIVVNQVKPQVEKGEVVVNVSLKSYQTGAQKDVLPPPEGGDQDGGSGGGSGGPGTGGEGSGNGSVTPPQLRANQTGPRVENEIINEGKSSETFDFILTGYYSIDNPQDQTAFTTVSNGGILYNPANNLNEPIPFIPSSLQDEEHLGPTLVQSYYDTVKKAILKQNKIEKLTKQIDIRDFDIQIVEWNNGTGTIKCNLIIKKGAQWFVDNEYYTSETNPDPDKPYVIEGVTFSNFKVDNSTTSIAANKETVRLPNTFSDGNNSYAINELVASWVYTNWGLDKYVYNPQDTTIADPLLNSFVEFVKLTIYNNHIFINLNPVAPIPKNPDDLFYIKSFTKVDNIKGSIDVEVVLKDGYYQTQGNPIAQPVDQPFIVSVAGFKALQPTRLLNPTNNDSNVPTWNEQLIWPDKNNISVYDAVAYNSNGELFAKIKDIIKNNYRSVQFPDISPTDPQKILELKKSDIELVIDNASIKNTPNDCSFSINVTINKPWVDANQPGVIQPAPYKTTISFSGFMYTNQTTVLNQPRLDTTPLTDKFLEVTGSDLKELIDSSSPTFDSILTNNIKQEIINNVLIQNWNGQKYRKLNVNDFMIEFVSANNLDGEVTFRIQLNNDLVLIDGNTPPASSTSTTTDLGNLTLNWFRNLDETEILQDYFNLNKQETVNKVINDMKSNNFQTIKGILARQPNIMKMFPTISGGDELLKDGVTNIEVASVNPNPSNQNNASFVLKFTINESWVDAYGNVQNGPFVTDVLFNGFRGNYKNTIVSGGELTGFGWYQGNETVASEAGKLTNDQKIVIAQQLISNNLIANTTEGKTNIQPSDIRIEYNGVYDNIHGIASFDITILNGFASVDGVEQSEYTFYDIKLSGFAQLTPTKIPSIAMNINQLPTDFLNTPNQALDTMKTNILASLKENMFLPGQRPTKNDIEINIVKKEDKTGEIIVSVKIIRVPYVNDDSMGSINWNEQGPSSQDPYPNAYVSDVKLFGFENNFNWASENWYIILISGLGGLGVVGILVLIILRLRQKNGFFA